jgi:hypothetical protein
MTYRISGLDPQPFAPFHYLSDEDLSARGIVRMLVTERPGFPCRVSLDDAEPGGTVLLLNHASVQDGPYAATHAIFVGEGGSEAAVFKDQVPPALARRILSLRAFDADHMMVAAILVQPGEADPAIRRLFEEPRVAYIHAHNAVRGCFAAVVERA